MVKRQVSYDTALERAAGICARGEHSQAEMERKARLWGLSGEDAARLSDWLVENGFVDEERFVRAFVHDKFRFEYWGRIKIRYALRQHGVSVGLVEQALKEIDETEYLGNLKMLLEAKFRSLSEDNPYRLKDKLFRYAAGRGFESKDVLPIIASLVDGADDFGDMIEES